MLNNTSGKFVLSGFIRNLRFEFTNGLRKSRQAFKPKSGTCMKVYDSHEIKNIALLGNDGSGKTTLLLCLIVLLLLFFPSKFRILYPTISRWNRITVTLCSPPFSMWNGWVRNSI